jgi:hypothetical protein
MMIQPVSVPTEFGQELLSIKKKLQNAFQAAHLPAAELAGFIRASKTFPTPTDLEESTSDVPVVNPQSGGSHTSESSPDSHAREPFEGGIPSHQLEDN